MLTFHITTTSSISPLSDLYLFIVFHSQFPLLSAPVHDPFFSTSTSSPYLFFLFCNLHIIPPFLYHYHVIIVILSSLLLHCCCAPIMTSSPLLLPLCHTPVLFHHHHHYTNLLHHTSTPHSFHLYPLFFTLHFSPIHIHSLLSFSLLIHIHCFPLSTISTFFCHLLMMSLLLHHLCCALTVTSLPLHFHCCIIFIISSSLYCLYHATILI